MCLGNKFIIKNYDNNSNKQTGERYKNVVELIGIARNKKNNSQHKRSTFKEIGQKLINTQPSTLQVGEQKWGILKFLVKTKC